MEINLGHELVVSGTRRANHRGVVCVNGIANVGALRVEGNGRLVAFIFFCVVESHFCYTMASSNCILSLCEDNAEEKEKIRVLCRSSNVEMSCGPAPIKKVECLGASPPF
jgi:hypothetical protein